MRRRAQPRLGLGHPSLSLLARFIFYLELLAVREAIQLDRELGLLLGGGCGGGGRAAGRGARRCRRAGRKPAKRGRRHAQPVLEQLRQFGDLGMMRAWGMMRV